MEALRQLRLARRGAVKARTAAANQMHSLTDTAPEMLRTKLRPLSTRARARTASRFRPGDVLSPEGGTKRALVSVAKRWLALDEEIRDLDKAIKQLLDQLAPALVARLPCLWLDAWYICCRF